MERVPDEVLHGTQQAVQLGQHNGERVHRLKALGELQREQLLTYFHTTTHRFLRFDAAFITTEVWAELS